MFRGRFRSGRGGLSRVYAAFKGVPSPLISLSFKPLPKVIASSHQLLDSAPSCPITTTHSHLPPHPWPATPFFHLCLCSLTLDLLTFSPCKLLLPAHLVLAPCRPGCCYGAGLETPWAVGCKAMGRGGSGRLNSLLLSFACLGHPMCTSCEPSGSPSQVGPPGFMCAQMPWLGSHEAARLCLLYRFRTSLLVSTALPRPNSLSP